MNRRLFYLLTWLPSLPVLGEEPPVALNEMLTQVRSEGGPELARIADLFELETTLTDKIAQRVQSPMPSRGNGGSGGSGNAISAAPLHTERDEFGDIAGLESMRTVWASAPADASLGDTWLSAAWEAWFELLWAAGRSIGSPLLCTYAAWEWALRLRLVGERLRRDPTLAEHPWAAAQRDHAEAITNASFANESSTNAATFAQAVAGAAFDERLIERWRTAPHPLAAERVLDEARWEFLDTGAKRYSFSIEELIAYFLKLRLLQRVHAFDRAKGSSLLEEVASL